MWKSITMTVAILVSCLLLATGCARKDEGKTVVGFSQIGAESDWRKANTVSIKAEAEKRGMTLQFSDAQQKQENQIKAIRSFITQGVDLIAFSPVKETGWEPVLKEAKKAGIPVILSDRTIDVTDDSLYTTFIGSDVTEEGRKAGRWLAKATDGKATIVELTGTPGSAPANDRKAGFEEIINKYPGMKIIKSQTGDFTRSNGKKVMESFLKSPECDDITVLYAHNDDMALGAIQAIEAAGKKPGEDIIIVSVDAVKAALEAIVEGKLNCSVECNALIGPQLFDLIEQITAGKEVPKRVHVIETVFDKTNAAEALPERQY